MQALSKPQIRFAAIAASVLLAAWRLLSRKWFGLERELFSIEEWALRYEEDAVEPELEVLDAHHHMWDLSVHDKGWPVPMFILKVLCALKPWIIQAFGRKAVPPEIQNCFGIVRLPVIAPYMARELLRDIRGNGRGHKVIGTMYMECGWKTPGVAECMQPVKEADMVTEVHRRNPTLCVAIIAHVDLRLGKAVEPALQYLKQNPLVKGIRHALAWSADPTVANAECASKDLAYDPKFREGFALLAKYGYSFDSWLFHEQIDDLADLARTFPSTTVVCDHLGFPLGLGSYRLKDVEAKWQQSMRELAKQPNVVVKIGGMGMRFWGFGFDTRERPATSDELVAAWGPYIRFVVETFGCDRCIMESNFPMDKVSCTYTTLFNALKKAVARCSPEDKRNMFSLNAKRVYRVD